MKITYTNISCQEAGNEVRKRLGKKGKYEAGEVLICRLYRNEKEGQFNVNIRWKALDVRGDELTIQDIKNERDVRVVNEKVVDTHFFEMRIVPLVILVKEHQWQHYHSRMEQRIFSEYRVFIL